MCAVIYRIDRIFYSNHRRSYFLNSVAGKYHPVIDLKKGKGSKYDFSFLKIYSNSIGFLERGRFN